MNFTDWCNKQRMNEDVPVPANNTTGITPGEYAGQIDSTKYTVVKLSGRPYAFLDKHFIDLSALKSAMENTYQANGYPMIGMAKLSAIDLGRYNTSVQYIKELLLTSMTTEVDVDDAATYMLQHEHLYFTR